MLNVIQLSWRPFAVTNLWNGLTHLHLITGCNFVKKEIWHIIQVWKVPLPNAILHNRAYHFWTLHMQIINWYSYLYLWLLVLCELCIMNEICTVGTKLSEMLISWHLKINLQASLNCKGKKIKNSLFLPVCVLGVNFSNFGCIELLWIQLLPIVKFE